MNARGNEQAATVAVVIPVYNGAAYIEEALRSIEAQTRTPERVVVIDDGSTDDTGRKINRFAGQSSLPIETISQENAGIAAARNVGVARCREDLIAFLDGDDTFYPPFLERAANVLTNHAELVLCFLDRDVVDAQGRFLRRDLDQPDFRAMRVEYEPDGTATLVDNPFTTLAAGNVIPIGLMVRRSAFERVGGFDVSQRMVEDKPFLLRLAKTGQFGFIDEPLGIWRRHGSNTSGAKNAFKMALYDDMALEKLEREARQWSLSTPELQAIRDERRRLANSLLYTASNEAVIDFFPIAARLIREGRVHWRPVLRSVLRYGWRSAGRLHRTQAR
jgi:glycosyltransferase involved in cell wall biosynthesis